MPLQINTNISSINAQRHLARNTRGLNKTLEQLASGFRINRASDDAAGLQVSENLRAQIRGSKKALDNVQDGINLLNIADGSLSTIGENIQRIRELVVQAANDTYDATQRQAIAQEVDARRADIDRIANASEYNGVPLLSSAGVPATFSIQVGANNVAANDVVDIAGPLGDATTAITGLSGGGFPDPLFSLSSSLFLTSNAQARQYLGAVDGALTEVNTRRGQLGALVNRLESAGENLQIATENLSASESRIRDVDVASASASLTRFQILQQASSTVLSQANQSPSLALQLIGGQ